MSQNNHRKYLKNKDKKKEKEKETILDILNDSFTIPQEKYIINHEEIDCSFLPKKVNSLNTQSLASFPTFSTITSKEKKLSHSTDSKKKKSKKESCFKDKNKKKKKRVNFKDKLVEICEIQSYKKYNNIENINYEVKDRVYCKCDIY